MKGEKSKDLFNRSNKKLPEEEKKEEKNQNVMINTFSNNKEEVKEEAKEEDQFVTIQADSNELSIKKSAMGDGDAAGQYRCESDRVSFSRAISLYRASNNNSIESSMKGTRWSFGSKLEPGGATRFIFMPQEIIKVKYRVLQMV